MEEAHFDTLSLLLPTDKVRARGAVPIDLCDHERPETHESVVQPVLLKKKSTIFHDNIVT